MSEKHFSFLTSATGHLAPMILSLSEQKGNLSKYLQLEMAFTFKLSCGPKSSSKKSTTTLGLFLLLFVK